MSQSIKTRFMIISDTHNYDFSDKANTHVPLQHPLPKCDVLLHAGDLTNIGTLLELEGVIDMLANIDAELKLVIAGNHDLTLDGVYWKRLCDRSQKLSAGVDWDDMDDDDPNDHEKALAIMTGAKAREAGVTYLEEGLHTFTLKSGATFTIYASPYQPEFCNMAFPYFRNEDRFNPIQYVAEGVRQVQGVKIPDFPAVDIMMTHGPPHGILDEVRQGRMTAHVGCSALLTASSRARPQLYCFGHIHEGHGAELITWSNNGFVGEHAISARERHAITYPSPLETNIQRGYQTLMVNAAINTLRYKPTNTPWVVDLKLPGTNSDAMDVN